MEDEVLFEVLSSRLPQDLALLVADNLIEYESPLSAQILMRQTAEPRMAVFLNRAGMNGTNIVPGQVH